jgi:hypothetical protein
VFPFNLFKEKVTFVCFHCSKEFRESFADCEQFYFMELNSPKKPPNFVCPKCCEGLAYPKNYTNKYGYTFRSEQLIGKNAQISWKLTKTR